MSSVSIVLARWPELANAHASLQLNSSFQIIISAKVKNCTRQNIFWAAAYGGVIKDLLRNN